MHLGVVRLPRKRLLDGRFRRGKGPSAVLCDGQVELRIRQVRLQVQRLPERRFGFRRLPGGQPYPAEIAEGLGVAGIALGRPPVGISGGIRSPQGFQRRTEIVFGFREIRFQHDGVPEGATGRVVPALRHENQAIQVVAIGQAGGAGDGLCNAFLRGGHVALLIGDDGQKIERVGVAWIDRQDIPEPCRRRVVLACLEGGGLQ